MRQGRPRRALRRLQPPGGLVPGGGWVPGGGPPCGGMPPGGGPPCGGLAPGGGIPAGGGPLGGGPPCGGLAPGGGIPAGGGPPCGGLAPGGGFWGSAGCALTKVVPSANTANSAVLFTITLSFRQGDAWPNSAPTIHLLGIVGVFPAKSTYGSPRSPQTSRGFVGCLASARVGLPLGPAHAKITVYEISLHRPRPEASR